jgi:phosphatidylglycerophosphate synthase
VGAVLVSSLWIAGASPGTALLAVWLYAAVCIVAVTRISAFHPHSRLGPANVVTFARAGFACLIAAMVLAPALSSAWWYTIFVLALVALALDGIDGWASRHTGLVSRFGARFDMEVDALLVLVLSASACLHGKAGGWVLLIGAMRYLFVATSLAVPALRRSLPPSVRRQAVCVLQVGILAILLLPEIVPPASTALAAAALAALTWSFAIDVHWLLRAGRPA